MIEQTPTFCSDIASDNHVPLLGTATREDAWFLIEYAGPWGAKAFDESDIPPAVKNHLNFEFEGQRPPRNILIRQSDSRERDGIHFFVAFTDPVAPKLYQFKLQTYTDLLEIDLPALLIDQSTYAEYLRPQPLYLACVNGRRDACCARAGVQTYQAMQMEAGEAVWQSSHLGGHNKAPVTLFLPHGVQYGRAGAAEIIYLMREYQGGRVVLDYLRGRVCFDPPVQAAAHFWREENGVLSLPGLQVQAVETLGDHQWRVQVSGVAGDNPRSYQIEEQFSDIEIAITCAGDKISPITTFISK